MIARVRAWLARPGTDVLAARDTRIAQLEGELSKESLLAAGLEGDVKRLTTQNIALRQRAEVAEGIAARLQADHTYVTAERCECGGDAELYWRTRAHEAERQGERDRDNARRMADQVAYWRERYDAAEHQVHVAEQLGRAR
jgi:hypothetical protein